MEGELKKAKAEEGLNRRVAGLTAAFAEKGRDKKSA